MASVTILLSCLSLRPSPSDLRLDHLHPLLPELADNPGRIDQRLPRRLRQSHIDGDEGSSPPHATVAVNEDRASRGLVLGLDATLEHEEGTSVVGNATVRPRREVELRHSAHIA